MGYQSGVTEAIAEAIAASRSIVAFTGAGISTPSGIPDFRSPSSGLWNDVDPLSVASIFGFRQNPEAFYRWVYPLAKVTLQAQPNAAHLALADLEARGLLKAVITQNIDTLHTRAGNTIVHELHGHLREVTCTHCFMVYPGEPIMARFLDDLRVPHCPHCNGVLKPNVILFGEQLPYRELAAAKEAARRADLMIVVGSSLEVAPASDLPLMALRNNAKLVVINLEATFIDPQAWMVIRGNAAEALPEIMSHLERVG
jgi:NAD-dependent deacetylase